MNSLSKLVALLSACFLLSGCFSLPKNLDNLKEPQVSLTGLAVKDLNPLSPSFLVNLKVQNPNDLEVDLSGADVALALNGKPVAKGLSKSPLALARHGSSDLAVEVTADTLGAVQQVLGLLNRPALDYEVTGHLHLVKWLGALGQLPFSFKGSLDRETLLRGAGALGALGR
jgi:LEA14-like dessication related protein